MDARPQIDSRNAWKAVAAQGVLALLLGIVLVFAPVTTFLTLAILFGIFALIDGLLALATIFMVRPGESRWALAAYAAAGIVIGILAIAWPGLTVAVLATLVGIWAIVVGVSRIAAAMRHEPYQKHWSQWIVGIAAILFGLYVLLSPRGLAVVVFGLGLYAFVKGILLLIAAGRMRSAGHRPGGEAPAEERRRAA